jgi:arylsulfatase A-like enzyme
MFLSDNGACAEPIGKGKPDALRVDHPRSFQGVLLPWANASTTPFRQFKHWTHEGGIATPLIACWPGRISAGSINRKQVGHVIDLMPTVVELAETQFPREILVERTIFWEHEGNRAVRRGRWKLVAHYNDNLGDTNVALGKRSGRCELYDMEADRTELRDLAALHPEIVRELAAAHRAWEQRIGVRDWESLLRMGGLDEIK